MKSFFQIFAIILLCLTAITLIALQQPLGWLLYIAGLLSLLFCPRHFAKDTLLIYLSFGVLGFTKITTDISYIHMTTMGIELGLAVMVPYIISRFVYGDYLVRFAFHHGRSWYKTEILYIFATVAVSYLLLPFYLRNTGAYLNWTVTPGLDSILRLFIGTNALGIWDELFFISTILGILRRFFPFWIANVMQGILFTSFLYELGFRGWGFIMIFIFALIQGFVFKKTESLFYVITIHLSLDFILFLALIHAHHPSWLPIFFT